MWELDHEGWVPENWYFQTVLLRVPWTTRKSHQSMLKEINLEYSLEGLMLTLKLQYFGHQMWTAVSLEKTLMLGKNWSRGWNDWMASLTQWARVWASSRDGEAPGSLVLCSPWGCKESDMTEWLNSNKRLFCVWTTWLSQARDRRTHNLVQLSSFEFCTEIWSQSSK